MFFFGGGVGIWRQSQKSTLSRRSEAPEEMGQDRVQTMRMGHHAQGKEQPFLPLRLNRKREEREGRLVVILKWQG